MDIVVWGDEMSGIREPWIMHCSRCSIFGSLLKRFDSSNDRLTLRNDHCILM